MKMRANRRADRKEYDLLLLTFPDSQKNALNKECAEQGMRLADFGPAIPAWREASGECRPHLDFPG
jgi:hypothetical protein